MKKTYLYMVVCAAALMMAGCAQDTTDANGNFPKAKSISIGAKIANPEQGRTGLDEEWGDGIRAVYWEADDQVAIIDDTNAARVLSLNPEEEMWGPDYAGYTMFYGEAIVDFTQSKYPAVYPADVVESGDKNSISLTLPKEQTRVEGGGSLMYATNSQDDSTTADGAYLEFVNLVGYLELQVVGNGSVSKVFVESASQKLSGAATLVPTYEVGVIPELTVTGDSEVTLTPETPVQLDSAEPTSFFVSIPAGTYPAGDLTITFYTTDGAVVVTSSQEHVLEASHIKPLTMTVASSTEYIDLTAGEKYANTFIVSAEGDYKFAAKTKEGLTTINHPKSGEELFVIGGETAQACCVWESNDGMITNVIWNPYEGVINFHYNGIEGNALVSLVAEDGQALWNWHIWGTDQPAEQVIGQNTYMDRNLGAWDIPTSVDEIANFMHRDWNNAKGMPRSAGLIYEWGRPIPFPGVGRCHTRLTAVYDREDYTVVFGNLSVKTSNNKNDTGRYGITATYYFPGVDILTNGGYVDRSSQATSGTYTNKWYYANHTNGNTSMSTADFKTTLQHPMSWYGVAGSGPIENRFWSKDLFTHGYDFDQTYSPWNYAEGTVLGKAYDVCPYGYHVPNGAEAVADYATLTLKWKSSYTDLVVKDGHTLLTTTAQTSTGAVWGTTTAGDFVWIPASGIRVNYGQGADDYMIRWWCSTNNDKASNIGFMLDPNDAAKINASVINSYTYCVENNKNKSECPTISTGFAIRCVKDK